MLRCKWFGIVAMVVTLVSGICNAETKPRETLKKLIEEIAPEKGLARPPYQLARYDVALKKQFKKDEEVTLKRLRELAIIRQDRLERLWKRVSAMKPANALERAQLGLLQYAFDGTGDKKAWKSAREAGFGASLRLARFQLEECNFDSGIAKLIELADCNDVRRDEALVLLIQHSVFRDVLRKHVRLLPLSPGLDTYLDRRGRDPGVKAMIEALKKRVKVDAYGAETEEIEPEPMDPEEVIEDGEEVFPCEPDSELQLQSLSRACLQVRTDELTLRTQAKGPVYRENIEFTLSSNFNGKLRFRLYRFADEESWQKLDPTTVAAATPIREWSKEYVARRLNNRHEIRDRKVVVDKLKKEGYYLLTCEAPYSPVIAAHRFVVSHVALYLRAGRNQAVVMAVDRRNGQPIPNQPVTLAVEGAVDVGKAFGSGVAFRDGFYGNITPGGPTTWDGTRPRGPWDIEPEAELRWYGSYAAGKEARKRYPPISQRFKAKTNADGSVAIPLDIGRCDYQYNIAAFATGRAFAKANVNYSHEEEPDDRLKSLVWTAQPIYRPGSVINFKGILRDFNGRRLKHADPNPKIVKLIVRSPKGIVWQETCKVSPAGCISGQFKLKSTSDLGGYHFLINKRRCGYKPEFTVQEFRRPTFKVTVDCRSRELSGGDQSEATVRVEYTHGAPADGAEVEMYLKVGSKENALTTATTDKHGRAVVKLPPMPSVKKDSYVQVRAVVMDVAGQSYTGTTYLSLKADAFRVDCIAGRSIKGEPTQIKVSVSSWDWRPLSKAVVMADGVRTAEVTDKDGQATVTINEDRLGYQKRTIRVVSNGKVVTHEVGFNVDAPPKEGDNQKRGVNRLALSAGRCDAGQELELKVELESVDGKERSVLILCENTDLLTHRAMILKPGKHKIRIPTTLAFAPSLTVRAFAFMGENVLLSDMHRTIIKPVQRFLNLKILTDRKDYRPGEVCNVEVHATDWKGRPAPNADISLGVIDRSIYWLREEPVPDVFSYFHQFTLPDLPVGRYDYPLNIDPQYLWKGPKYALGYFETRPWGGRRAIARYGGSSRYGGAGYGMANPRVDFRSEAFWVANLLTDKDGKAKAKFVFPDSITEWRFTARGATAHNLIGGITVKHHTRLPLRVDLQLPRAMRVGDDVRMKALVWNDGSQKTVQTTQVVGAEQSTAPLRVPGNGRIPLIVAMNPQKRGEFAVTVGVEDKASKLTDAAKKTLSVLPRGHRRSHVASASLDSNGVIPLGFGGEVIPGSRKLVFTLDRGVNDAIKTALDGLIAYPYGCVEQTMSRFMPAVVASHAMKKVGIKSERTKMLPEVIEKGIKRLMDFQHSDGAWGWWKHDDSNIFMTAYVLEGLSLCKISGTQVPDHVLRNAEHWLSGKLYGGYLEKHKPYDLGAVDLRTYTAHSLATYYSADPTRHKSQIARLVDNVPASRADGSPLGFRDNILRIDTLRLLGEYKEAMAELDLAMKKVPAITKDRAAILAAAALIEVGKKLDAHRTGANPHRSRWARLGNGLLRLRNGHGWGDTLLTASVVRGLVPLLDADPTVRPIAELRIGGKVLAKVTCKNDGPATCVLNDDQLVGKTVTVHPLRKGGFWSASLEAYLKDPPQAPKNPEATVSLVVSRVQPTITPLAVANGTLQAKQGETVELALICDVKKTMSFIRLTLPRPCGLEFLSAPKLRDGVVAFEQRDDAFHIFIDAWKPGKHIVKLRARSELSGKVFAPLPELVPMYGDVPPIHVIAPILWALKAK